MFLVICLIVWLLGYYLMPFAVDSILDSPFKPISNYHVQRKEPLDRTESDIILVHQSDDGKFYYYRFVYPSDILVHLNIANINNHRYTFAIVYNSASNADTHQISKKHMETGKISYIHAASVEYKFIQQIRNNCPSISKYLIHISDQNSGEFDAIIATGH